MTPEEKSLLERTYKMAEENNAILRGIRRSNRWSTVFRVLYWVIIIGLGVVSYYFVQPYLTTAMNLYNQVQSQIHNVQAGLNEVQNTASSVKSMLPR